MEPTYNEWEHLQSTVMQAYNRIVRDEFNDVVDDDGISTPRSSLKVACLVKDDDSAPMVAIRMAFFYMTCRKAQDLQRPVYGIPVGTFDEVRKYRPQVILHFVEPYEETDTADGYQPVYGQASFRLMSETSQSLTEAELRTIGNRLKTQLGTGNGFVWRKGRNQVTYDNPGQGFGLRIACTSESEGRDVVQAIVQVAGRTVDLSKVNYKENAAPAEAFPTNPGNQTILGKSRKNPRRRPVANVRFRYATCLIHGLPNPIILYDKTGRYRNALVTDF